MFKKQQQKQMTAYEKTTIHNNFWQTINCLEKYIEVVRNRSGSPEKVEKLLSYQLLAFSENLEDTLPLFREDLKREFYKWLSAAGINPNNCPKRLKHFLLGFDKVLESRGEKEKLAREKPFLTRPAEEELEKELKIFASIQIPLQKQSFLESKSKFNASVEQGKETFKQIAENVANEHDRFQFFSQKEREWYPEKAITSSRGLYFYASSQQISSEIIIQDLKNYPQNWRIDEIPTEIDSSGWIKNQEFVLIHCSAREDDFDSKGKLNFTNNPIFRASHFNQTEINEINKFLNITKDLASLIEQRSETKDKISGIIEEVIRFKTWWSNHNVATVINYYEDYYQVFLVVYEPAEKSRSEILETFEINNGYDKSSLESAKNKASSLRNGLNGENPILAIIGSCGTISPNTALNDYVLKREIPHKEEIEERGGSSCQCYPDCPRYHCDCHDDTRIDGVNHIYPDNPDEYLRPLDIVWIEKSFIANYFHVGIYLGNGKVSHIVGTPLNKEGMRIADWTDFTKGGIGKLIRHHSIIPFKHYEKIAKQVAWTENMRWREEEYCLAGQNCEHAANMVIHGIEYSKQVSERPNLAEFFNRKYAANKNRSDSLVLGNEISRSNNQLGEMNNKRTEEIKEVYQAQIEISARSNCRIM